MIDVDGSPHLSFILGSLAEKDQDTAADPLGVGVITDSSYNVRSRVPIRAGMEDFNMHEFKVFDAGRKSLIVTKKRQQENVSDLILSSSGTQITNDGFQEVDLETGATIFEWNSLDHGVSPTETTRTEDAWDYMYGYQDLIVLIVLTFSSHINSVDKSPAGDFLVSGRHTDCIYKISGVDGSIIWRLGGVQSSIVLEDFNFSRQHDARFRSENSTTTIISFLDNASDEYDTKTSAYSSAVEVAIYTSTSRMTAKVLRRWARPDRSFTYLRGNVQYLPESENVFVGWSDRGYMSEFTADGTCVLEADFASGRFCTYRAYKFNFTGTPTEPPVLKNLNYAGLKGETVSTFHVSWNGATDVAAWKFYGSQTKSGEFAELGSVNRTGFETTFASHYVSWSYAEAVAANGTVLGKSGVQDTIDLPGNSVPDDNLEEQSLFTAPGSAWQPTWPGFVVLMMVAAAASFLSTGLFHYERLRWTDSKHRYQSVPDTGI